MIFDVVKRFMKTPCRHPNFAAGKEDPLDFPLDPQSPWPKFRGCGIQNGRSEAVYGASFSAAGREPWEFQTGKGIFSSPVVDGDGTVYIGSADHYFYAVTREGKLKWRFATGEIIDSSALLDDRKRVYFGSGDGHVYCLNRESGQQVWRFAAHSTKEVESQFGIKTYNLNWFEGNMAMLGDGTLIAPNDNYLVYALDRDSGELKTRFPANEMVWSCPAVNPDTSRIFFASCFNALVNIFCCDTRTGKKIWTSGGLGSISASPLLTSKDREGLVLVGGFDGMLRALSQKTGKQVWAFGTRDHIYGSPAQLSNGTIVQASCDGTLYGINPATGKAAWTFDTPEPIRSSPVVDAGGRIYFGSGMGRLFCINPDGSYRWSYRCIRGNRNDLNGSPALGPDGVCIGGETGGLFFVPYDYPLTGAGRADPRCGLEGELAMPRDGSRFYYVSPFGKTLAEPPRTIDANAPLMFTHMVREENRTLLSAIEAKSLKVTIADGTPARVAVSANKKFITLMPKETWTGPEGGALDIHIQGDFRTGLCRAGLKFFSGRKTHSFAGRFRLAVAPYPDSSSGTAETEAAMPYRIPEKPGDPATVFEFSRLSCPNPTMLPSYNQIGFDSLHYLAVVVAGEGNRALVWVVPGRLDESTGKTLVDPNLADTYFMEMIYNNGLVTFYCYDRFAISFVGSWDMPFGLYRIASRVDPRTGSFLSHGALNAEIHCDDIKFYGRFLKLTGMSDMKTGLMHICGGLNLGIWEMEASAQPPDPGKISLTITEGQAVARITDGNMTAADHVWGILLVHGGTGRPVPANYARKTRVETGTNGIISAVVLDLEGIVLPDAVRGFVMMDTTMVFAARVGIASESAKASS